MFADAEDIKPHGIRKFDFLHQIAQALAGIRCLACGRVHRGFAETIDAELHKAGSFRDGGETG